MQSSKKLVILGHPCVGKTAITRQFVDGRFIEKHESTIEDSYVKYFEVDEEKSALEILDTAGDEKYSSIRENQLKAGQGFLLCFSITDRSSFYSIRRYYQDIVRSHQSSVHPSLSPPTRKHSGSDDPEQHQGRDRHLSSLLSASNANLHRFSDPPASSEYAQMQKELQVGIVLVGNKSDEEYAGKVERQVTSEEIYSLAQELHLHYHEISAQKHAEVSLVFEDLVRACRLVNAEDCICGAAVASQKGKKHPPCSCHQVCAQCHRKRSLHNKRDGDEGAEQHPFVNPAGEKQQECCAIQ